MLHLIARSIADEKNLPIEVNFHLDTSLNKSQYVFTKTSNAIVVNLTDPYQF